MKTIAPAAMAAIEAGDAIVTGAVEIYGNEIGDVAVNVVGTGLTGSLAERTTSIGVNSPSSEVILSKPLAADDARLQWDAWSAWPTDTYSGPLTPPPVHTQTWLNNFSIYGNNGGADVLLFEPVLDADLYASAAAAYAALAAQLPVTLTGYSTYKVVTPNDNHPPDNRGGLSLLLTGVAVPIRLWGGYGPITFGGVDYKGIGARGLAQQNAGAVGGVAQGLTLSLSGVEAAALDLLDSNEIKRASVVLYRLIFASDGKMLLDAHVFDRGRVDTVGTEEAIGGVASINAAVESAARGLGRAGGRMRADSDQRLIDADDGYFKNTAYAAQKMLYWGGKRPYKAG